MSRLRAALRVAVLAVFALALASVPFLHLRLGARHTHVHDTVAQATGHPR
jgi:hypothetical protein